jgi:hypothetical protein
LASDLEARQELLDGVGDAVDELGYALACLGAAYEQLDEATADALEEQLFGPVQVAYGRAKRAYAGFAARHGLTERAFEAQEAGPPSTRARGFIDNGVAAIGQAGGALASVQDAPLFMDLGDRELRDGVTEVRALLGDLPQRARELVRRLGR